MPSHVQPRRIIINGHPTSIRLEPAFWGWLREIAAECGMTAKALIERNFSCEERVKLDGAFRLLLLGPRASISAISGDTASTLLRNFRHPVCC